MVNNKNTVIRIMQVLVILALFNSCNSGKEKSNSTESQEKVEKSAQFTAISYEECDSLTDSPNYRYGFVFEKRDSIQENVTIHHMIRMYYDHFEEKNSWEGQDPFYSTFGVITFFAFPKDNMDKPIKVFEIDGINNHLTAFGKQIKNDEFLKYQEDGAFNFYYIKWQSSLLLWSAESADANDVLVVNCFFGYLKQGVKHVFRRSYILDVSSKACISVGEYVCPCYWKNDAGEVVGLGQIYAERGFGGLTYGYIYMAGINYVGWSTKKQEYNPIIHPDKFPYEIPNKSWTFGALDTEYQMPKSMTRGGERYEFNYVDRVITHYENNKRVESLYYDDELDDPRIWDVEHIGAKVAEYEFGNNGGLWRVKYWSKNGSFYMPVTINNEGKENRPWEVYRVGPNPYNDIKIVRVEKENNYDNDMYAILELDETTGLYNRVATIKNENNIKSFLLEQYLDW